MIHQLLCMLWWLEMPLLQWHGWCFLCTRTQSFWARNVWARTFTKTCCSQLMSTLKWNELLILSSTLMIQLNIFCAKRSFFQSTNRVATMMVACNSAIKKGRDKHIDQSISNQIIQIIWDIIGTWKDWPDCWRNKQIVVQTEHAMVSMQQHIGSPFSSKLTQDWSWKHATTTKQVTQSNRQSVVQWSKLTELFHNQATFSVCPVQSNKTSLIVEMHKEQST